MKYTEFTLPSKQTCGVRAFATGNGTLPKHYCSKGDQWSSNAVSNSCASLHRMFHVTHNKYVVKRKQEFINIFLSVFFYSILSRNAPDISRKTFGGIEIWHRTIFSHFPNLLFIDPQPHLTVVRAPGRGKLKPFLSEVENLNLELSSPFSRIKVFYLLI